MTLRDEWKRGSKPHRCSLCEEPIPVGIAFCALAENNPTEARRYGRMAAFFFSVSCGVVLTMIGAAYYG